jgi:excisionase family DNA binding protein
VLQGSARGRAPLRVIEGGGGRLLSVREIASRLGVSTATAYGLIDKGALRHARVSNAIRVAPADLEAFIAAQSRGGEL